MVRILVTGGAGYIGQHTVVELLNANKEYEITIIDNLSNSSVDCLDKIQEININNIRPLFYKIDLCDSKSLNEFFEKTGKYDVVIHFAGLKAVGESVTSPLIYYKNNFCGTYNLFVNLFRLRVYYFQITILMYN